MSHNPSENMLPADDHSEDGYAVSFRRLDDGGIVATTVVSPSSPDWMLFDWLERQARQLTRGEGA